MKNVLILLLMSVFPLGSLFAISIQGTSVQYKDGKDTLKGYLAYDADLKGKRPTVLIVHEWKGLDDYAKKRARQLAERGYLAFAVDIYGDGQVLKTVEDAAKMSSAYKSNPKKLRGRIQAAYDFIKSNPQFDSQRVAAIGYCFGGTTVLEWARAGAKVDGVVSFHGGLKTDLPAKKSSVRAKVLVLHGAEDPYVPEAELVSFENEMRKANADWQLVKFGGAVHGFSRSDAGRNTKSGYAYDKKADARSYEMMLQFFDEIFG
jgi:dienelactone hydrolase